MAERAQELAECFAQANAHFTAFVEQIPGDQWDKPLSAEDIRSAAIVARHVAYGNAFQQRYFHAIAAGRPLLDVDLSQIETLNAELARQWQFVRKEEVLAELQRVGQEVTAWVQGLSQEQLAQTGPYWIGGPCLSTDQWIERALLGHIEGHLRELRTTLGV
jgi:hypothetical protein